MSFYVRREQEFIQRLFCARLFFGLRPSVLLVHRQRALDRALNRRRFGSDIDSLPPLEDSDSDDDSLPPLVHPDDEFYEVVD